MKPYTWRSAILKSGLKPTTRHVLLTLSCYVNDVGQSAYPSTKTLASDTGLSERAVITHLHEASDAGWLKVRKHGFGGQNWSRNEYYPCTPAGFFDTEGAEACSAPSGKALNVATKGTERRSKGTEPNDKKALKDVQSNSPIELSKELSNKDIRATRLSTDWKPSISDAEFLQEKRPDLNLTDVAETFRDYWIAQPGAKGVKTDWPATWRNWVRNQRQQPGRAAPVKQSRHAGFDALNYSEGVSADGRIN